MENPQAAVGRAFAGRFGRRPEGVWAAPARVNLIGEHADDNDGFVLPLAIDRRVAVAAARRADGLLRLVSLDKGEERLRLADARPGAVRGWAAYAAGVPCGIMDQMAALACTAAYVLLLDCRSLEADQVPFAPADAGLALLVVDTRVSHALADGAYAERRAACEQAARILGVPALRDAAQVSAPELHAAVAAGFSERGFRDPAVFAVQPADGGRGVA